jgi:hypothetical protein
MGIDILIKMANDHTDHLNQPTMVKYGRATDMYDIPDEIFSETDECCVICTDEYRNQLVMTALPCGHIFHKDCIKTWFRQKRQCPLCK